MNIVCQRLFNQRIDGEKFEKPEEVVGWLGAIQVQDYLQSLWAIGLRLKSATVADIQQAISDGKIVRTWPMRGTLHFVPSEDAKWMLKLSASRTLAKDGRRLNQLGLDEEIMERCKELFYDALRGGKRLSRPDMMKLLEEAGIKYREWARLSYSVVRVSGWPDMPGSDARQTANICAVGRVGAQF